MQTDSLLQQALALHQSGQFDAAHAAYQAVLKKSPKDINALNFMGILCFQRGDVQEGCRFLRKCLQIRPDFAQAHNNLGNGLMQSGMAREAVQCFSRAVALSPIYGEAHANLAAALVRLKDYKAALRHGEKAVELAPTHAAAWAVVASIHYGLGDLAQAMSLALRSESLAPGLPEAGLVRARVLWDQEKFMDAIAAYRTVIGRLGNDRDALLEYGSRLLEAGRPEEALPCLLRRAEIAPNDVAGLKWLAAAYKADLKEADAEQVLSKAIALAPKREDLLVDLSEVLASQKKFEAAEAAARKALQLSPDSLAAAFRLAATLAEMNRLDDAFGYLEDLLRAHPESTDVLSGLLFLSNYTTTALSPARRRELAGKYGHLVSTRAVATFDSWLADDGTQRLRVGLVSGDLLDHPVGRFLENVLPWIDRDIIEVIAYPTHRSFDELSLRLMPHLSAWKPIGAMNDRDAAELIRNDGVHILVDLAGHTAANRLPLFAWRPAPIQISWLGYFATTGVPQIDYFIADEVGSPAWMEAQFSERIWRLPETRLCFAPPLAAGEVAPLPALANGYVTFGSFQNIKKMQDPVLKLWVSVLSQVPGSRLRLQSHGFHDAAVAQAFLSRFEAAGGDPVRLDLFGPVSREEYLAAHAEVDIILDTFPFPGGTTTCEALWMGVPTVTLAGETLVARQGACMMAAAGLEEWVANDDEDYVCRAVAHAGDPGALSRLRGELRERLPHSALFDGRRFASHFVKALQAIWQTKR